MKTKLLFLFIIVASTLSAQFTVGADSVYALYDSDEPDVAVNNSHTTMNPVVTMKWEVVSISVPSGWENDIFICDAIQCWDSTTNFNQYDLPDNKVYPLDCHFLNNGTIGEANAKIRIWEVGDSASTAKIVTFQVEIEEAVGVKSVNEINLAIFPNPAIDYINIVNMDNRDIMKIEIYNIIGRKVNEINHPSSNESIPVSNLEKGVYIILVTDKKHNNYSLNFTKN